MPIDVEVQAQIVPKNGAPFPVADTKHLVGGRHTVKTLAERDAIPAYLRKLGMVAYVSDLQVTYWLPEGIGNEHWEVLPSKIAFALPKPILTITNDRSYDQNLMNSHDRLFVHWEDLEDKRFLDLNPELWLFRYRRTSKNGKNTKRWRHPTHQNGAKYEGTSSPFGGKQFFTDTTTLLPPRNTEFAFSPEPWLKQELDMQAHLWFSRKTPTVREIAPAALAPADFPTPVYPFHEFHACGRRFNKGRYRYLNHLFRFRVAIDNPVGGNQNPKLFGPWSDMLIMRIESKNRQSSQFASYRYYL